MSGMQKMNHTNRRCWILSALIVVALVLCSIVTTWILVRDYRLDLKQKAAITELLEHKGEYDEKSIVLQNTTFARAKKLADEFGARLRITYDGHFATLTISDN